MRRVEAIITQMVTTRAIVVLDDDFQVVEVEELIEEEKREDTEFASLVEIVEEEQELPEHREVER